MASSVPHIFAMAIVPFYLLVYWRKEIQRVRRATKNDEHSGKVGAESVQAIAFA
jgi:hypothetical protein